MQKTLVDPTLESIRWPIRNEVTWVCRIEGDQAFSMRDADGEFLTTEAGAALSMEPVEALELRKGGIDICYDERGHDDFLLDRR